MDDVIRIGRVSSVDPQTGMIAVTYPDRMNGGDTKPFPVLANGFYRCPQIGEQVVVAHLENGTASGVVLGVIQNESQKVPNSSPTQAVLDFSKGALLLQDSGGSITVTDIIRRIEALEEAE